MEDSKKALQELKDNYKKLQEKYSLLDFQEMNENFHIERIAENETELLIKEIRRFVADKISGYLRFIETLLNPMNVQMFIFSIIKSLRNEDKNKLTEIYNKLSKIEVKLIKIDLKYSEQNEAEFIKEACKIWEEVKEDLLSIIATIEKNWDVKPESNNKNYFG